ncbi:MAG TPA: response regulator [Polyangiaceae bacterium]
MGFFPARAEEGGMPTDQSGTFRPLGTEQRPHVVVVDDDFAVARQLALALELEGVDATTAADSDEALATLGRAEADERPVDLVLVELMLPRRSGLELARELRARYPNLRIVLTGAYHLSERQLAMAGCNAIAFVPKPCEPAVVAAFVKRKVSKS